jgi:dolichol-phosphate mannosyltransferase
VPLKRRLISRGGTVLSNALLRTRLTDMTSGFQMFSRAALQSVLERGIRSEGPFFQTEMKAHCHDMRVAEVPITYSSPNHNMSNATLKDALRNLWRMSRLKREGRL